MKLADFQTVIVKGSIVPRLIRMRGALEVLNRQGLLDDSQVSALDELRARMKAKQ